MIFQLWQNIPSLINPIAFEIGPLAFHWYSFSYLAAFLTVYLLLRWRINKGEISNLSLAALESFMLHAIAGLLIGARLGYVLFYDFSFFLGQPLLIFWPVSDGSFVGLSGMSFHGGLIGVVLASLIFIRKHKLPFLDLADFAIPAIPLGYFWGRIGNFLGGELFGRATENPWGMNFPLAPGTNLRHPSQLYEAFFEGLAIFAILWPLRNRPRLKNNFLALYLILYGVIRFLIEFVRAPDPQLGFVFLNLTMGQLLCLGMIIVGVAIATPKFKTHLRSNSPNKMSKR